MSPALPRVLAADGTATLSGDLTLAERVGAGLTEGVVRVDGSVGDRAGAGVQRGRLELGGDAGHSTGEGMSGGSLICLGSVEPSATYRYACIIQPVCLRLRRRRLRETHGLPLTAAHLDGRFRRFSGDFSETGRGEILACSPA